MGRLEAIHHRHVAIHKNKLKPWSIFVVEVFNNHIQGFLTVESRRNKLLFNSKFVNQNGRKCLNIEYLVVNYQYFVLLFDQNLGVWAIHLTGLRIHWYMDKGAFYFRRDRIIFNFWMIYKPSKAVIPEIGRMVYYLGRLEVLCFPSEFKMLLVQVLAAALIQAWHALIIGLLRLCELKGKLEIWPMA